MQEEGEPVDAKNVIGIVEGSHPELKQECVVFMAHYDHLGVNEDGDVYNGADDNGSGTVTLMEVAEAFSSLKEKPKRSIVFLWVTAEEIGLFGSRFYTENPVVPLEKTVTCINIDMDGRVYEPRDSVWKRSPKMVKDFDGLFTLSNQIWPELNEISNANCEKLGLIPDNSLPEHFLRSSDHYHFHNNNVPILNFATGYHADYHKVGDEVSKINFEKIKRVSDLCFLVGLEIANMEEIKF
jgi:Zn-dependent M28 family amino/carboxypeptidase